MDRTRAIVLSVIVIGCGDNAAGPPADAGEPLFEGGTAELADCGYAVTTRFSAQAPQRSRLELGPDPTPFHVHLGFAGDPRRSIAILWRTRDETTRATMVRYALGDAVPAAQLNRLHLGFNFAYESTGTVDPRVHEAHLCDLAPDTSYSYQVGSQVGDLEHWSPVYSFRTAPDVTADPAAEVRIAVVGDTRDGYDVWQQVVDQIALRAPDLVLFTGDAVTIGIEQREWETFFERAEPLFARAPVLAAHGNHEVNAVHYFSQFAMPGDEENFGFDYGWAHFTVVNDTPAMTGDLDDIVTPALAADLAASAGARWKIGMHHRGTWSASTNHGSDLDVQRRFMPLYDQHDVDLVLNGHDHDYEISRPLTWDAVNAIGVVAASPADGTVFQVNGGAGAGLYGNGTGYWTEYSESTHGASILTVRRDQMTLDGFRADGTPIPIGYSETK